MEHCPSAAVYASGNARVAMRDYIEGGVQVMVTAKPCPCCRHRWLIESETVCGACAERARLQARKDRATLLFGGWIACCSIVVFVAHVFGNDSPTNVLLSGAVLEVIALSAYVWRARR